MDVLSVLIGVHGEFSVTCCPYNTVAFDPTYARLTLVNGSRTSYCMGVGDLLIFDGENTPHYGNALEMSALRLHVPYVRNTTLSSDRSPLIDKESSVIAYAATNLHLIKDDFRK